MPTALRHISTALILVVVLALTLVHARGPKAKPADAPSHEFSAGRARAILQDLVGDGKPHPVGTAAHEVLLNRITQRFRDLGYETAVETGQGCSAHGLCARVENLIASLPDKGEGKVVLLVAHYDSVPAGPGAADDASSVAAWLEIARILAGEPRRRNPVVFLIDDGEEGGLLGAEEFMAHSKWARRVGAIVNLEARGTRGESFMFETSSGNRWLIDELAHALPRPDTTSLFYEIYKRLPNDTDFTVFKRYGKEGLNFAFIGDVSHYHTPLDDLAHLSRRSLQHHGDNGLAMARALASADLDAKQKSDLVWFDLFSTTVVRWPAPWSVPLAAVSAAILLALLFLASRKNRLSPREAGWGILFWLTSSVVTMALAAAVVYIMQLRSGGLAFPAHPFSAIAACWLIGLAVPMVLAGWFGKKGGVVGLAFGSAAGFSILALATAWFVPGTSYLFIPAAILFSVAVLVLALRPGAGADVANLVVVAVGAAILFPLAWTLFDAIGLPILIVSAFLVALVTMIWCSSLPVATSPRAGFVPGSLAVVAILIGLIPHTYSADSPQRFNFFFLIDTDRKTAECLAPVSGKQLPDSVSQAATWSPLSMAPFPWYLRAKFLSTSLPQPPLAAPAISVLRDETIGGERSIRLGLHSTRNASLMALTLHDGGRVEAIRADGWLLTPFSADYRRWISPGWTRVVELGGKDVEIDLVLRGSAPLDAVVEDQTYDLPPAAASIAQARGRLAVPSDDGDRTIVRKKVTF